MTKDIRRKKILKRRDELSAEEIQLRSSLITRRLMSLEEYRSAENILVYASFGSEAVTDEIITKALELDKKVFCPKITDPKKGEMIFARIKDLSDLVPGAFGIREPESGEIYGGLTDDSESLVIMPGVAFDADRNRYGYGGGYYDRFLAGHSRIKSVALAFECQISKERLDVDENDIRPSLIVTEERIY